jgi:hypothetical protein
MFNDEAVKLLSDVKSQLENLAKEAKLTEESSIELLDSIISLYSITPNDIKKEKNLYHN